jgi:putative addiction module component (TIGR02574 family)
VENDFLKRQDTMIELPAEIRNLPVAERLTLVTALWDSIAEDEASIELTSDQKAELERRLEAHANRPPSGATWADVKRRILGE